MSGKLIPPVPVFFLKIALATQGFLLYSHTRCEISCSSSVKNTFDSLIITLSVNRLNVLTKRYRMAERIQKQDPYICCLPETHFRYKDKYRLKVTGQKKKCILCKWKAKNAGAAILISGKKSRP